MASIVRELVYSREEKEALGIVISELKGTIRRYRDEHGVDE